MASNGPLDFRSSVHNAWQQADQCCSGQNHISQLGTDGQSHSWIAQHCKTPAVSLHPRKGPGNVSKGVRDGWMRQLGDLLSLGQSAKR